MGHYLPIAYMDVYLVEKIRNGWNSVSDSKCPNVKFDCIIETLYSVLWVAWLLYIIYTLPPKQSVHVLRGWLFANEEFAINTQKHLQERD